MIFDPEITVPLGVTMYPMVSPVSLMIFNAPPQKARICLGRS
jgi:hypothetical protein